MRLKELRLEKRLTQWEVANGIKTRQSNIERWENGKVLPNSDFIIKLADFFEVSTDYLLGRSDDLGNVTIQNALTETETEVLRRYRGLRKEHQDDFLIFLRAMSGGVPLSEISKLS